MSKIKRYNNFEILKEDQRQRTYDQSKEDFEICKREVEVAIKDL